MRQSAIGTYKNCPFKYYLQYVADIKTIPNQNPDNPLICGTALHYGAETESIDKMIELYKSSFYSVGDLHINEIIKLEHILPNLLELKHNLGSKFTHEITFKKGTFHGTADLLVHWNPDNDKDVDLYDYKYCSEKSAEKYKESPQLHIYKYFLEDLGYKVRKMGFIFIPKVSIRQKKTEDLYQFRKRLTDELNKVNPYVFYLDYDSKKTLDSFITCIEMLEIKEYPKTPSKLCDWCEYKKYCLEGEDCMLLPKNERREAVIDQNPDFWIYADSYVGKSTFVDQLEDLLFLNTDGNTDNTTSPVIRIKDEITVEGRITNIKYAWEVFKKVIEELEKQYAAGTLNFKRVAIDLIEDVREHCRLYMYEKLNIQHESDAGYGKGYDIVQTEFLSTIKRFKNIGFQIIYISKELKETVTLKNGTSYNAFRPNIPEKIANVLAGTVDLTIRAYMDGDKRYIQLTKDDVTFGGGRFNFKNKKCELNMADFMAELKAAQVGKKVKEEYPVKQEVKKETPLTVEEFTQPEEETPKRRSRRS